MEPNYLSVDEIDWELYVRGLVIEGNLDTKRQILRGHIRNEKLMSVVHPKVTLDAEREQGICLDKATTLEAMVTKFASDARHPDYKRLKTKLLHLRKRISYFEVNSQEGANLKAQLLTKIIMLFDMLESKVENVPSIDLVSLENENINVEVLTPASESILPNNNTCVPQIMTTEVTTPQYVDQNHSLGTASAQVVNSINQCKISSSFYVPVTTVPSGNSQSNFNPTRLNHTAPCGFNPQNFSTSRWNQNALGGENFSYVTDNLNRNLPFSTNLMGHSVQFNEPISTQFSYRQNLPNGNQVNMNEPMNVTNLQANSHMYNGLPMSTPQNIPTGFQNVSPDFANLNQTYTLPSARNHNDSSQFYFRLSQSHRNLLKFDGKNQTLHNFLERVNEFTMSHNINPDQLLTFAHEFFEGDALILFRSIRGQCHTWSDLVSQLKSVFLPCDFESALWDAIRDRKQGVSEKILIFIAIIENLFKRFSYPIDEQTQLRVIMKNLQPYYQDRLALRYPSCINELKHLCKTLEDVKLSNTSFGEPGRGHPNILGPEYSLPKTFMYKSPSKTQVNEIFTSKSEEVVDNVVDERVNSNVEINAVSSIKCWNCNTQGHAYVKCTAKKTKFCYGCGKKNVIKPKCPECQLKNGKSADPEPVDAAADL